MKTLAPLLGLFAAACIVAPIERTPAPKRPNVLLLIGDDHGWADLSAAGLLDDVATPRLDGLAERGVRFTQAYATSPICNASRAGLMTGTYQQRFGTFWYGGKGMHDAFFLTLAERLAFANYERAYVGKFHYGASTQHEPGKRSFPLEHGYESLYGFSDGRKHYLRHTEAAEGSFQAVKGLYERRGQSLEQGPFWEDEQRMDQEGFSTELLGERARAFLQAERERPFFLTVAFNAVHNFTHQLPEEYLKDHGLEGYPGDWDPAKEEYYDWYKRGRFPNNPEGRAQYLGQLEYMDREVGRILDELDAQGLREDTIVIYVGDNGGSTPIYANNGPLRGSKYTLYEGGLRVPLIVSWPGRFAEGQVRDEVVSTMDVFPTICAAGNLRSPAHLDGEDLAPLLGTEPGVTHHEVLYWDTNHEYAVRQGRWKLHVVKSNQHAAYEMVELEKGTFLRDLEADPGETSDLSQEYPRIVQRLQALYGAWRGTLR